MMLHTHISEFNRNHRFAPNFYLHHIMYEKLCVKIIKTF